MSLITVPSPQPHKNCFLWSREASPELWGCKNLLASVFCDGVGAGTPGMPLLLAHAKIQLGLCHSQRAVLVDGRSNVKMKTQAHRARCWRASHVAKGSLADKGKMDTLARIKMYRFYSPKPTTERMKRFCPSNRGHKELLLMDMKRTDSLVAATRDLSKRLGKQLFNWLMNDHYANSEKKNQGKGARTWLARWQYQHSSTTAGVSVCQPCWVAKSPTHPMLLFPDLSTLPHGHNGRLPVSILVVAQTQAAPESPVAEHLDERCWVDHSVDPKQL